ncbi:unnamed protein product, partial [Aphanomyces euteiches]
MNRNKPLKSDVFYYVEWLRVHTAGYHLYAPGDKEKPQAPPENAKIEKNNDGGANRGTPSNEQRGAMPARPKSKCLKSGKDDHKVRQPKNGRCIIATPSKHQRSASSTPKKWEEARTKVAKLNQPVHQSLGCEAKIEDIVSVSTILLDNGPDVTLVTAGVIISPEDAGVDVTTVSAEAIKIQRYDQAAALKLDRQVQFNMVTLETPCGPLALCGLKAWVGNTSNAAELLIDHEVMERLGFSENDFLSDAFAKQEGWDVSNVDKPSDF